MLQTTKQTTRTPLNFEKFAATKIQRNQMKSLKGGEDTIIVEELIIG